MPRRPAWLVFLASTLFAAASACSGSGATNGDSPTDAGGAPSADAGLAPATSDLPCDVAGLVAAKCQSCHGATPKFGAPMPLVTRADFAAAARPDASKRVGDLVVARVKDEARPMPQPPNARLADNEIAVLERWVGGGMPAAAAACGDAPRADAGSPVKPLACTPDLHLVPPTKWTMTAPEQYVCFGVEVPVTAKRHVVAIAPHIDDARFVHHVVVLQSTTPVSPTPAPCAGTILTPNTRMVYAWAPGGANLELPPAAGLPLEGTTHYIVQIHYNNAAALPNPTDGSGVDLCTTTELRPNDADVLAFGTHSIRIPAKGKLDTTCDLAVPAGFGEIHAFSAFPHMHQLGKTMETVAKPGGTGAAVDLGKQAQWDFANQPWLPVDVTLRPGDVVSTRCAWENPTDREVRFGEKTSDEMCYSFTMYYPRIVSAQWHWALPAGTSRCAPTK